MLNLLKRFPWWFWIAVAIAIFILWQSLSGWAQSRKLYNLALDNLRDDQSKVVRILEENQQMYEAEIGRMMRELEQVRQQQAIVRAENQRLIGRIDELEKDREAIIVPVDPDQLVDGFRKLGFGSVHRRKQ